MSRPFGGPTHTYALMRVRPAVYDEIRALLIAAGYEHAIHDHDNRHGELDMHGIALTKRGCPLDTDGDGNCHKHPEGCP